MILKASASGADPSTRWDITLCTYHLCSWSISPFAFVLLYCPSACLVVLAMACVYLLIGALVCLECISSHLSFSNVPGVRFPKSLMLSLALLIPSPQVHSTALQTPCITCTHTTLSMVVTLDVVVHMQR